MTTGLRVVAKGRLTYRGEVSSTDLHGFICPRGVSCPTFPPCHCQHDFPLTVTRSSLSVRSFPRYTSSTLSCLRKGGNPDPRGQGRLYPTIHCHHQKYWQKPRSHEVGEEGDYTQRYTLAVTIRGTGRNPDPGWWRKRETIPNDTVTIRSTGRNPDPGRWGKRETIPNDTLTTRMILHEDGHR